MSGSSRKSLILFESKSRIEAEFVADRYALLPTVNVVLTESVVTLPCESTTTAPLPKTPLLSGSDNPASVTS